MMIPYRFCIALLWHVVRLTCIKRKPVYSMKLSWLLLIMIITPFNAFAAGFALTEQQGNLSNSFAGSAAVAEDASTIFFNPAGLVRLNDDTQLIATLDILAPKIDFTNTLSRVNPNLGGNPITGSDGGDAGVIVPIPNLYLAHRINERLSAGVGINAPFGLITEYEHGWVGRYHALKSELQTININPSLAWRMNKNLSLGVGLNAQYIDIELSNALDQSSICLASGFPLCAGAGLATPGNPDTDAKVGIRMDSWGVGFNIGLLYEADSDTRLGIHYRSKISHTPEGSADFSQITLPTALTLTGAFTDQGASTKLVLPDSLSIGVFHNMSKSLSVMAGMTWTQWSRFQQLVVRFDSGQPDQVTPANWQDTWKFSVGFNYQMNSKWNLFTGFVYDETPIPNAALRNPRLPDGDRYWFAGGLSYRHSDQFSLKLGLSQLFIGNVDLDNTEVNTGHVLAGKADVSASAIRFQIDWNW